MTDKTFKMTPEQERVVKALEDLAETGRALDETGQALLEVADELKAALKGSGLQAHMGGLLTSLLSGRRR